MNTEIKEIINTIKNPLTKKTLHEEGRIVDCLEQSGRLHITYSRDGIDPSTKRSIENSIIDAAKEHYGEDNIFVKTVSKNSSSDIYAKKQNNQTSERSEHKDPATLKVGHGTIGNKKRIENVDKVIVVSSCKGGVGKSTISVNLAISLKSQGKKVGIIDADIYGPSLPTLLNQRGQQPKASEVKKIKPLDIEGLKFISFGLFIPESDPVIWRGPMLGGVLNQLLFDVEWGKLDYIVMDLPPGTGDVQLSLVQNVEIDGAVVVSTPQQVALLDTKKGLNMFRQLKIPVIGMVENMSYFIPEDAPDKKYFIFGQGGVEKTCQELDIPFLGGIPLEPAIREGSDNGAPYMNNQTFKGSQTWKSYLEISKQIDDKLGGQKKGFFSKILGK